ncbi:MAG: hypothetical protein P4M12_08020 [Gammaproteobacteria bacterium]|nr:hypothetical protein [Gammaproteobacteria bacterium]
MPESRSSINIQLLDTYKKVTGEDWPFDALFTAEIKEKVKNKFNYFENANPVLNPGREKKVTWKDEANNILEFNRADFEKQKLMIAIGCVLDEEMDTHLIQEANNIINMSDENKINKSVTDGLITHIANKEKTVAYHDVYHPTEFAKVMLTLGDKLGAIVAAFHDIDQRFVKHSGVNEIKSAARLAKHLESEYGINSIIAQKIAWKTIVGGTTMMKGVDGQPTLYVAQQLISPSKNDTLAETTLKLSLADSHMPTLVPFLKTKPDVFHLPSQILDVEEKEILYNKLDMHENEIDAAAMAIGQNIRMFSELNASYNGALSQVNFNVNGNKIEGITAWNNAIQAARAGDDAELKFYLTAPSNTDIHVTNPDGLLKAGSTLVDLFANRINSEIGFARGQGAELIKNAAQLHGCESRFNLDVMNPNAWPEHANRMEGKFKSLDADSLKTLAIIFFKIAARQPGVYLAQEQMPYIKAKLDEEIKLKSVISKLSQEIEDINKQIEITKSVSSHPNLTQANTASMIQLKTQANADLVSSQQTELHKKENALTETHAQLKDLQAGKSNLESTIEVIQKVKPIPQKPKAQAQASVSVHAMKP